MTDEPTRKRGLNAECEELEAKIRDDEAEITRLVRASETLDGEIESVKNRIWGDKDALLDLYRKRLRS